MPTSNDYHGTIKSGFSWDYETDKEADEEQRSVHSDKLMNDSNLLHSWLHWDSSQATLVSEPEQ